MGIGTPVSFMEVDVNEEWAPFRTAEKSRASSRHPVNWTAVWKRQLHGPLSDTVLR